MITLLSNVRTKVDKLKKNCIELIFALNKVFVNK